MTQQTEGIALPADAPVIVGTAGHVDHGKSALVKMLTGTDPDRLPQEKARGITVDLGFAELSLPSGRACGLVDVPGHGHYVRAMVAGATGVDVALLVVAADDGVMPQTREHLRILELLGVRHMVVALTKSDVVEADWLELVQADVEDFLATTCFAGCQVVPVSSRTGQGAAQLLAALDKVIDDFLATGVVSARLGLPARLPIDRSFNLAGIGTVVTGTLRSGSVSVGDAVEICPGNVTSKVRSIQVHGHDVDKALAGQRTALNLGGVTCDEAARSMTVCAPGSLAMRDRFDARLSWLGREGHDEALESGTRVHVCLGTSQVLGRVLVFDGVATLAAGESALVQIRLEEPLALRAHDRFVIMSYSPVELVGGGEVLWGGSSRRTTPTQDERALLDALERRDDACAVADLLACSRLPLDATAVAASMDLPRELCARELQTLSARGGAVRIVRQGGSESYLDPRRFDEALQAISDALHGGEEPAVLPLLTLRDISCPRMSDEDFAAIADLAIERGVASRFEAALVAPEHAAGLMARSQAARQAVLARLDELGAAAPADVELAQDLGMELGQLRHALSSLVQTGQAEQVAKGQFLSSGVFDQVKQTVSRAINGGGGQATASELREALGLSRKYALPILEHLDSVGFTVRDGDARRLRT